MTRMFQILAAGSVLVILAGGCVPQEKYNALKLDRDAMAEQLGTAQSDAASARAEAQSYKDQLNAMLGGGQNLSALVSNQSQQIANLQAALEDANRKYQDALSRVGASPLSPAVTSELTAWANANPDLVDFDAARGIVKFKSDVTFASGDATLQPRAREVIVKFASILNSPAASGYELLIAGHTDSTRVSQQRTIAAGHKDNWYLSAHRAITVGQEMMNQRVNPERIGVVGYADQRRIASNSSEAGRAQNRRVEVLILPTTVRGGGVASTPNTRARTASPTLNKDAAGSSVEIDRTPAMNK